MSEINSPRRIHAEMALVWQSRLDASMRGWSKYECSSSRGVEDQAMANNREFSGKPLVSLEAGKLLGMRQVAEVSTGHADGASRDRAGSTGGAADSRAGTSRLLSKIDTETELAPAGIGAADSRAETSRLLSKIGVTETETAPAGIGAADSRAEMSRLFSKIDETPPKGVAESRAKMSRLLSKIGDAELPPPDGR